MTRGNILEKCFDTNERTNERRQRYKNSITRFSEFPCYRTHSAPWPRPKYKCANARRRMQSCRRSYNRVYPTRCTSPRPLYATFFYNILSPFTPNYCLSNPCRSIDSSRPVQYRLYRDARSSFRFENEIQVRAVVSARYRWSRSTPLKSCFY